MLLSFSSLKTSHLLQAQEGPMQLLRLICIFEIFEWKFEKPVVMSKFCLFLRSGSSKSETAVKRTETCHRHWNYVIFQIYKNVRNENRPQKSHWPFLQSALHLWCFPTSIDPCDIHHVGRRNNTILLLWEMKSIVMQNYFIVLSSNMAYVSGVYSPKQIKFLKPVVTICDLANWRCT